jgi:alpha-galactosidase
MKIYQQIMAVATLNVAFCVNVIAQTTDSAAPVAIAKEQASNTGNLAPTPPMGWNTWNTFQTNINEPLLKGMVDAYVSSGMRDAGYKYFVLDDGWMTMERDKNGDLVADPKKFPNGMKAFADYVHSKGLKFGIYNCAASYGVDFLKYDWCNTDSLNAREAYITMSQALKASGREITFSLCEWGNHQPWLWARGVGELYRTTGDITASFDKDKHNNTWTALSVMSILDKQPAIAQYNGPNHWNDPDMLEVGNGMTFNEDKAHFSLWCMLAAPLAAGNDLRKMSPQTQSILTNKAAIAIDQDALGIAASRIYQTDSLEVWVKPLVKNEVAVCFLNRSSSAKQVAYNWQAHPVKNEPNNVSIDFTQATFRLHDIWANKDLGTTKKAFKQSLDGHSVIVVKLAK